MIRALKRLVLGLALMASTTLGASAAVVVVRSEKIPVPPKGAGVRQ